MKRKVVGFARLVAAVALAGCHGARILEVDGGAAGAGGGATGTGGGGTTGAGGAAGRGGSTGAGGTQGRGGTGGGGAGGAAGGAGCAAQMTPMMFYRNLPPTWTEGTTNRFYWAEYDTPNITIHYADGAQPVETPHPFKMDTSLAHSYFDLAASDYYVVGDWYLDGRLAIWGPDMGSTMQWMTTLTNPGAVTAVGAVVFYSTDPMGGSPTPGIYGWSYPNITTLRASYTALGGTSQLGLMLRTTTQKILYSDVRQVYLIDIMPGASPQVLFPNQNNATIVDIRPARPHDLSAGVIVEIQDIRFVGGRDYYVDITQPAHAPTDLSAATTALAISTVCGYDAQYVGGGVLFNHRYVYQGQFGLFAVDVAANGALSNLVRLSDAAYSYLEVTGDGDLFGGWVDVDDTSKWDYSRIGRLAP